MVPRTPVDLLRRVDGVPHVVLGPLLLLAAPALAPRLGVPLTGLVVFLVVFVAYGALVVVLTRNRSVPAGLTAVAVKANLGCLVLALVALAAADLTALGVLVTSVLAASSAVVAVQLVRFATAPARA